MRIKTYHAKTMPDALRDIKAELGAEALILSTREVPCRSATGRQSSVEVVAAVDGPGMEHPDGSDRAEFSAMLPATPPSPPILPAAQECLDSYSRAVPIAARKPVRRTRKGQAAKKGESTGKRAVTNPKAPARSSPAGAPAVEGLTDSILRDLIARGVEEWLACKLLEVARGLHPGKRIRSRSTLVGLLREAVGAEIAGAGPREGLPGRRVVMFFGPTGVGKTTTIAKLAARLTLVNRKKVVLMTVDGLRIGAVEQLRTYASMMGIPFRFVNHIPALREAIEDQAHRDYVLIDTGGFSPRDVAALQELSSFLQETTQVERHLVLSATTSAADNRAAIERFEPCGPDYLLFTKLDEASRPGPILNELVHTRKPASFFTNGQRVPQDLHPVNAEGLLDIVLHAN